MGDQFGIDFSVIMLLTTVIGFLVLIMGRQIFWIFIAGLSFALGLFISSQYFTVQFDWRVFLISILSGIVGALLAVTFQRFAAGIAGFATGWYLSTVLLGYFSPDQASTELILPIAAGVVGTIFLVRYFDWGVIIASSLAGAAIILNGITLSRNIELSILLIFSIVGVVIQGIWFIQEK
jgi:hypothetical protein